MNPKEPEQKEIEPITLESIREMPSMYKGDAMRAYQDWVKKQREEDRINAYREARLKETIFMKNQFPDIYHVKNKRFHFRHKNKIFHENALEKSYPKLFSFLFADFKVFDKTEKLIIEEFELFRGKIDSMKVNDLFILISSKYPQINKEKIRRAVGRMTKNGSLLREGNTVAAKMRLP